MQAIRQTIPDHLCPFYNKVRKSYPVCPCLLLLVWQRDLIFWGSFSFYCKTYTGNRSTFVCRKANIANSNLSVKERHSPLENTEPLKTGFDQLLVHFEAVKWSNCSKNKITSGTRAHTEIKFALDGQGPHNFTQPISTGSKRLFDILVFRLKHHSLLWGLESNFRGST